MMSFGTWPGDRNEAPERTKDCDNDLILPYHQYNYQHDARHKIPTYSVNKDIFPLLTDLMESAEKISTKQFNQILNEFGDKFNHKILLKLIYHGLIGIYYHKQNKNAIEWLKYLNKSIEKTQQNEESLCMTNIDNLNLDSLSSICKFLKYEDIQSLELCNRNLLKTIRNNPQCITSYCCDLLDKNLLIQSLYRLSGVKQLTLSCSSAQSHNYGDYGHPRSTPGTTNERIIMDYIGSNITELVLYSDIMFNISNNYKLSSLEVLHFYNVSMDYNIITNFHLFSLCKIKDLMIEFAVDSNYYHNYHIRDKQRHEAQISFINGLLQFMELEKLTVSRSRFNEINYEDSFYSDFNIEPAEYPLFFKNLREFYWFNNRNDIIWKIFVHNVLQNCINLKVLNLNNVCNDAEYGGYNRLEELHLLSGFILNTKLLNHLTNYRTMLRKLSVTFDSSLVTVKSLDLLKLLLESQFYQHDMLTDICFTVYVAPYRAYTSNIVAVQLGLSRVIASIYLMLNDIFNDSRFKPLQSLNICLNIPSESDNKCYHSHLISNLLDRLYNKVEYCCVDIGTGIFKYGSEQYYDKKWCDNRYICSIAWNWDEIVVSNEWIVILETIRSGFLRIIKPKSFGIQTDINIPSISLDDVNDDSNLSIMSIEELRFQHSFGFETRQENENDTDEIIVDKIESATYPLKGWLFIQLQDTGDNNEKMESGYSGKIEKAIQRKEGENTTYFDNDEKEMEYVVKGRGNDNDT